jgi:folate/biopterin transporter
MLVSPSGVSKLKESLKEKVFFGNEPTPELIAILLIYFVQGILGLARLAVSFFLKDELGMSPAEVSAMLGVVAIPWIIKPLFGFMSDGLPIFGYRRRPYIVLAGLLGISAWVGMATVVHTPLAATGAIALSSLSLAVSDVIADSLIVERARKESVTDAGSLQSLSWGASAFGGLITAYLSGSLLQHFSTQTIFLITASFPLIISATAWLITEEKINKRTDFETVKDQLKQLKKAVSQKTIWLPTAFLFLWQSTPTSDSAFFFFSTNELGFQPEFLGRVRLVTSLAALAGIWLFQRFLKTVPFRVIFGWSTVIATALGLTTLLLVTHANRALGIDDQWFSIGDSLILTVVGQIAYMPVLVLSARLCPRGVEATLFALLMSITNLAGIISYEGGAIITHWLGITDRNFDNLWLLVVITNLSTLLPLPFLSWLPAESTESGDSNYQQSLPVLEPELGCSKPGGQHFMPEYFPDLVPTVISEARTADSK